MQSESDDAIKPNSTKRISDRRKEPIRNNYIQKFVCANTFSRLHTRTIFLLYVN